MSLIKGFYKVNKSDVLFKKLKNSRIQRKDENNFHAECTLFYDGGLMTGAMDISDQGHVEIVGLKPLFAGTKSVFSESSKDQMT